jgi:hypothetical protein
MNVTEYKALVKKKRKKTVLHESHIQQGYFEWLSKQYPKIYEITIAIPNAAAREKKNLFRMLREGLKPGMPDVVMFYPTLKHHGLIIEFKYGNKKPKKNQSIMLDNLARQGYRCVVCGRIDEAIEETRRYLSDITDTT